MTTPRFGLTVTPDSLLVDAVLAALEVHDHTGDGIRLGDPTGAPTGTLELTGGQLPAGGSLYYRYSLVDGRGFETAASGELAVVMPARVGSPAAPVVTTGAGGSLVPAGYYYFLTARSSTDETELSGLTYVTMAPGQGQAAVYAPAVAPTGVTDFGVWRQGPGEGGPTRIGAIAANGTFIDTGAVPPDDCPCDPGKLPPEFNSINGSNAVTVGLPLADAARVLAPGGAISSWRLYRASSSGGFSSNSLVATVFPDPVTGVFTTSVVDNGSIVLGPGGPSDTSRTLAPSKPIQGGGGGGGGGLVENPVLQAPGGGVWALDVDASGDLLAVPGVVIGTCYPRGHGPILTALDATLWQLGVDPDGALSTTTLAEPGPYDTVLAPAKGPLLHTSARDRYRLGVDVDGALLLTDLSEPPPPAPLAGFADAFADKGVIVGQGQQSFDNASYVREPSEPGSNDTPRNSAWAFFTPVTSGQAVIDTMLTTTGGTDTYLRLYAGAPNETDIAALSQIAADDDGGGSGTSRLAVNVEAGFTYYVQAGMWSSSSPNFTVRWSIP